MLKSDNFFDPSSRPYYYLRILILIFLGLTIYYQTFSFGFVFDDDMFIVNNPYIRDFHDIHYMWINCPITRLIGLYSFAFNYFIGQLNPKSYHIFNFLIHLLATGLAWALTRTLFKISGWLSLNDKLREELAFIVALFFLVHPCQTQAVSYISQRFESIATVFYFGSIWCYLRGRTSSINTHQNLFFAGAGLLALLGIFTKETPVTIPVMILAIELILLNKNLLNSKKSPSRGFFLLIIILSILFVLFFKGIVRTDFDIYLHFSGPSGAHDGDLITSGKYILTQMRVFLTFIRLLVFPINQNVDYDYPLSTGLFDPPLTAAGLFLIGFIVFLILRLRDQWPLIAFGLAWTMITFSINTVPRSHVIFEHKLYLISYGFFLATVCALSAIIKDHKVLINLLITLLVVLSLVSYKRNQVWENNYTLWNDSVQKSPHKARPNYNLGLANFKLGDLTRSTLDYNKAIEIKPDYAEAYINRGINYDKEGDFTLALSDYNKAIKIDPNIPEAYYNRGLTYMKKNNLTQALLDYNKAIDLYPDYVAPYFNRGSIYVMQGNLSKALSNYINIIEIDPNNADAYYSRGCVYQQQGNLAQALSDYNKAVELNPSLSGAYHNRAVAYYKLKEYDNAWVNVHKADK